MGAGSLGQPKQGRLCLHLGMAVPAPQLSARPGLLLRGPGHLEGTRQSAQHTGEVLKELEGLCCVCLFVLLCFSLHRSKSKGPPQGLACCLVPRIGALGLLAGAFPSQVTLLRATETRQGRLPVPQSPPTAAFRSPPPRQLSPEPGAAPGARRPPPGSRRRSPRWLRPSPSRPAGGARAGGGGREGREGGRRPEPEQEQEPGPGQRQGPGLAAAPAARTRPGPAAGCEMAAGGSRGLLGLWLLAAAGLAAGKAPSCHEVRTAFQLRQIGPLKLVPDVPTAGQCEEGGRERGAQVAPGGAVPGCVRPRCISFRPRRGLGRDLGQRGASRQVAFPAAELLSEPLRTARVAGRLGSEGAASCG